MSNPFQFSLRQMMMAVAFFCAGMSILVWTLMAEGRVVFLGVAMSGAVMGGGLGVIVRRPILLAICGGILFLAAVFIYIILNVEC